MPLEHYAILLDVFFYLGKTPKEKTISQSSKYDTLKYLKHVGYLLEKLRA